MDEDTFTYCSNNQKTKEEMITDNAIKIQRERIFNLLSEEDPEGLTRLQIARALGIERASVCYRVAELRDQGRIWVIKKGLCPITNTRAEFLTCSQDVAMRAKEDGEGE